MNSLFPTGTGLGFRRELVTALKTHSLDDIDFFEIAPENWMYAGGRYERQLREFSERFAFTCHGLSLSIGASTELDRNLLKNIKQFMALHDIELYTEHLSWCSDDGHLYDLLPIPCTEEAVHWVAKRIRQAQDILGRQIGIENASYYFSPPGAEMKEEEFICAVVKEADCLLHLDVNNIYVNSQNFNFDPLDYMHALPLDKVCYLHVAGHYVESDGIVVDTHGAEVIDPVWALLDSAYQALPRPALNLPTCLERDFNFPPLEELIAEINKIKAMQKAYSKKDEKAQMVSSLG